MRVPEVTETCLDGLLSLLRSKSGMLSVEACAYCAQNAVYLTRTEQVVAESVVAIKKLLQLQPNKNGDVIKQLCYLLDKIEIGSARASIVWVCMRGEWGAWLYACVLMSILP